MERGAATIRLQLIDEIDPELAAKFLSLMSEDAASECLSRMDQEKAKRRQARDLLEGIGDQRPGHRQ
jgi:flagellar motility protein MotE (MotC chaperone)